MQAWKPRSFCGSKYSEIVSLDLECAPCQKRECPLGHHHCMELLKPETVYSVLKKYLVSPVGRTGGLPLEGESGIREEVKP